jgi:hypothetical protein
MSSDYNPENIIKLKIKDICFNDWNPKDNDRAYNRVKKSVAVNGMMMPVFVRETENGFELVDGNQRVRAAEELGYSEIYAYNLGKITDEEAKQLVLYMQVQVPFDSILLAPLAVKLESVGMELPFSEKEMEKFRDLEAFDMETAFQDEETPLENVEKPDLDNKMKNYRIKLENEDFDFVRTAIDKVIMSENVNEGRALELLVVGEEES